MKTKTKVLQKEIKVGDGIMAKNETNKEKTYKVQQMLEFFIYNNSGKGRNVAIERTKSTLKSRLRKK